MVNPNIAAARERRFSKTTRQQRVKALQSKKIAAQPKKVLVKEDINQTKKLNDLLLKSKALEEKYEKRQKERTGRSKDKARADDYAQGKVQNELNKIISQSKKGAVFDFNEINNYLREVERFYYKKKLNKLDINREPEKNTMPQPKKKNETFLFITDPIVFGEKQSDALLKAKDRKKFQQDFTKKYGIDAYSEVAQIASAKMKERDYTINSEKLKQSFTNTRTGDDETFKLVTRDDIKQYNLNPFVPKEDKIKLPKFSEDVSVYNQKINELNKKQNKLKDTITKIASKKTDFQKLNNLVITGQSMTPRQQETYLAAVANENKKLTKAQLNVVKDTLKGLKDTDYRKIIKDIKKEGVQGINWIKTLKLKDVKETGDIITTKIKGLTPSAIRNIFVSDDSIKALKKIKTPKDITFKEGLSLTLDVIGAIPVAKGTVLASKFIGKKVLGLSLKQTTKQQARAGLIKQSVMFTGSVANNAGFAKRMYETAQKIYAVDNNYLAKQGKELGFTSSEQFYKAYLETVQKEFKDKTIKLEDLAGFLGADLASRNSIIKAQRKFAKALKDKGLKQTEINKILGNLENKRRARVWGQVLGVLSVEVSSERLASKLIETGVKKKTAIGTAAVREGFGSLAQETYVQENNILPSDLFGAVILGTSFLISPDISNFFSKSKYRKLTKKELDKANNKLAKTFNKSISKGKKFKYVDKVLKKNGINIPKKDLSKTFNKKEIDALSLNYIRNTFAKNRTKKIDKVTTKKMFRDPVGNILDIAEYPGDLIYDLGQTLKRKILRLKPRKRVKVKSVVITKAASKTKGKSKASGKATSKAVSKSKSKSKAKTTSKAVSKTTTKAVSKAVSKTKAKSKAKAKAKAKAKSKAKAKAKVKTIPLLTIPKFKEIKKTKGINVAYSLRYTKNNKPLIIKTSLPKNAAIKRAQQEVKLKGVKIEVIPTGSTKKKDLNTVQILKQFKLTGNERKYILSKKL